MFQLPYIPFEMKPSITEDWEFEFLGLEVFPKIIGLTGPTKCGKTMIAKRLATEYGFFYVNLGSILSKIVSTMGEADLSAKQLGNFGRSLRELKGADILAHLAFRILKNQAKLPDKIILDSLLHPMEIEFFRRRSNLILIGIEANRDVRFHQLMGWAGIKSEEAEQILSERDEHEQYHGSRQDIFSPNIDECLELVKKPEWLISIETEMTNQTVYEPLDSIMDRLSKEWALKRVAAPMSSNNYPYWNQKLPDQR